MVYRTIEGTGEDGDWWIGVSWGVLWCECVCKHACVSVHSQVFICVCVSVTDLLDELIALLQFEGSVLQGGGGTVEHLQPLLID